MKGISTVIATLLLLVITISLVGLVYGYISGLITTSSTKVISLVDVTCRDANTISITVKNNDPVNDVNDDLTILVGGAPCSGQFTNNIPKGTSSTQQVGCSGLGTTGGHVVKIIGPTNAPERTVVCP